MAGCDMHERLPMAEFNSQDKPAGMVFDVSSSLDDLIVLNRKRAGPDGAKIPEVDFTDPKIIEDASAAITEGKERLTKAGYDDGAPHSETSNRGEMTILQDRIVLYPDHL
jgi:hypothetical protein